MTKTIHFQQLCPPLEARVSVLDFYREQLGAGFLFL